MVVDGQIRARADLNLTPGATAQVIVPAGPEELAALATAISAEPPSVKLSPAVLDALTLLATDPRLVVRGTLGAGWLYDGEYLIQNYAEGAPATRSTVNAAAPLLSLGVEARPVPALALGAGVDLIAPLGDDQTLPVGADTVRLRLYPHVAIGHPYLQVTAGALLPWRLGVGARLNVPLSDHLGVQAAYVYGVGRDIERESGAEFESTDASMAWLGATWRWQGLTH